MWEQFAIRPSLNKMSDKTWYPGAPRGGCSHAPQFYYWIALLKQLHLCTKFSVYWQFDTFKLSVFVLIVFQWPGQTLTVLWHFLKFKYLHVLSILFYRNSCTGYDHSGLQEPYASEHIRLWLHWPQHPYIRSSRVLPYMVKQRKRSTSQKYNHPLASAGNSKRPARWTITVQQSRGTK